MNKDVQKHLINNNVQWTSKKTFRIWSKKTVEQADGTLAVQINNTEYEIKIYKDA
jgi:hypothetical protein